MWLDAADLEDDWPAPSPRPRRSIPIAIAGLLVVALVAIWAFGGFDRHTERPFVPHDTTIETGPLKVTVSHALARLREGTESSDAYWSVTVVGVCENTTDEPLLSSISGAFAAQIPGTDSSTTAKFMTHSFDHTPNPGLGGQRCEINFEFPGDQQPLDRLLLGIFDLEWRDKSMANTGGETWHSSGTGVRMWVPLSIVA